MEFTAATERWQVPVLRGELAQEGELSERIYSILMRWLPFANEQFREWDGRPNAGHFFGGSFWYCSDTLSMTFIYAVMAKLGAYDERITGIPRELLKERAIKGLRYAGFTHDTGPEDCVRVEGVLPYTSLKKWGGRGDNFFMATQNGRTVNWMCHAAWLLWDDLDDETRLLVQNVAASYADRWCEEEPRNGTYYDTQCEENAWTAAGIGAAALLFPDHPHNAAWTKGYEQWASSTVTTFRDRLADPSGLIDTPAGNRVKTVTFHPDMTTENHAFVHPSYVCAGTNLRGLIATMALMGGRKPQASVLRNNEELYNRTVRVWAQFDGLAIPVQGQDWWYNRQHERQVTHAILNVLHGHPDAALLERRALDSIERIQASNGRGCLLEERGEECVINRDHAQFAKDLEPGSALDLATSYLLHLFGGEGAEASTDRDFRSRMSGVHYYPYGSSVVHRTADTFTSFSWRNNVMALSLPRKGLWSVTPLYASFTGTVKFAESKGTKGLTNEDVIRDTERSHVTTYADGFGAIATIARGDRELLQDVAFIALPNGKSVYYERFLVEKPCQVLDWQTGLVGVRNENYRAMPELAKGTRTVYLPGREMTFAGFYGEQPNGVHDFAGGDATYLNMDGEIGYLLYGSRGIRYLNKHEYPKWKGVEDILTLNRMGEASFDAPQELEPFVAVAMPNQSLEETRQAFDATAVLLGAEPVSSKDAAIVEADGYLAFVHLGSERSMVEARRYADPAVASLYVYEGTTHVAGGSVVWRKELEPFASGYFTARYALRCEIVTGAVDLELSLQGDRLVVLNGGAEEVRVTLVTLADEAEKELIVPAHGFAALGR
ncbi:hypothetical protein [Paenibacillus koleovorans]|uniref:hypothetical protein n=1 Tax=Paenibacillus koleovorans TaxID=121608 RepID=UPI000FD6F8E8|nr:hypothetical protein [Paenibacillus koleovorans]